jgi:hypothetical protein
MRQRTILLVLLLTASAVPTFAQSSVSLASSDRKLAAGVSLGVAIPGEKLFGSGATLTIFGEKYLTPRLSVRGQLMTAWWKIDELDTEASASPLALGANLIYNWDRGRWHPYASAGFGIYRFGFTEADLDSSDTQAGLTAGGGVEIHLDTRSAVTVDLTLHPVAGSADSLLNDYAPWFSTLSVGYKRFF